MAIWPWVLRYFINLAAQKSEWKQLEPKYEIDGDATNRLSRNLPDGNSDTEDRFPASWKSWPSKHLVRRVSSWETKRFHSHECCKGDQPRSQKHQQVSDLVTDYAHLEKIQGTEHWPRLDHCRGLLRPIQDQVCGRDEAAYANYFRPAGVRSFEQPRAGLDLWRVQSTKELSCSQEVELV